MEVHTPSGKAAYKIMREILEMQSEAGRAWDDVYGRVKTDSKKKIVINSNEGVRYLNIITNFEKETIWKEGEINRHSLRQSALFHLWKILLENKGERISMKLLDATLRKDSKSTSGADKTYYNLIEKLADVSGLDNPAIQKWFLKDKNGITLRNLE